MSGGPHAGRTAVVTGGTRGIGAAAARRLSAEGARVVVVARDASEARATAAALPGEAVGVGADVSTEAGVEAYVAAAERAFGGADLAFLNAGGAGRMAPISELELDEFDAVVAVNLRSVFLGLRAALRGMGAAAGGAVVISASTAGLRGSNLPAYSAAKHGAVALAQSAAVEGAALGVRVNAIAPDSIETPMMQALIERLGGGERARRQLSAMTPLGRQQERFGSPEEVASLVSYLLGPEAGWITGAIVPVDGGILATDVHRAHAD
jgi:NAD(P)-dependent dehydrogenase (short-subunit alcohol dehydrogenase family)